MKKILFLNGNKKSEFYNNERNKYEGVLAESIFKNNKTNSKIIRRLMHKLKLPGLPSLFGSWKYDIEKYDLFIISTSIYSPQIAKYIRKKTDKKIIHWYWNPVIDDISPQKLKKEDYEIWSFDKEDCEKYKLKYIPTYYFNTIELPKEKIVNDVYFVGADKGRLDKLVEIEDDLKIRNIKTNFHITKSKNSNESKYQFKENISYETVLKEIAKSKVILDYIQEGQSGLTQRPMESIFHSKKLITNDKCIKNYDFYNKENIFILGEDNINDISYFVNSPYIEVEKSIIDKYDFKNWIKKIKK